MGTGIIITMAVATVGSGVTQSIFNSLGKTTEAQYLDLATKSGLVVTALGIFAKVVTSLTSLG